MFSRLNVYCITVNHRQVTTPGLVRVVSVKVSYAITRWCWAIVDRRGSSVLTHVSVSAGLDRSDDQSLSCGVVVPC